MKKISHLILIHGSKINLEKIETKQYLIVGAGGLGSEILKNLINAGGLNITILDYDRIEFINLNRNFFKGTEYAQKGTYKVEALQKEYKILSPQVEITALPKNIFDYDENFISKFDVIFCAVDSIKARTYLSTLCIKSNKPMFDGGVHGIFGQTKTQISGETECYNCTRGFGTVSEPLPCTIRTIPQIEPHAVLWSKTVIQSIMDRFAKGYDPDIKVSFSDIKDFEQDYGEKVFDFLFYDLIEDLKKSSEIDFLEPLTFKKAILLQEKNSSSVSKEEIFEKQKTFSVSHYASSFLKFIHELYQNRTKIKPNDYKDKTILNLINSLSNLRIHNFKQVSGLNYISMFQIQDILYEITPVLSSTSSIIGGLLVIEAVKYILGKKEDLRSIWISDTVPERLIAMENTKNDPSCLVCGSSQIYKSVRVKSKTTLAEFIDKNDLSSYLKNMNIILNNIIYDSDDEEDELRLIYAENLKSELYTLAQKMYKSQITNFNMIITIKIPEKTINYDIEIKDN